MSYRYPQPDNEVAFEQFCLRFYRKIWKNESLALYAKRGEKQDGVDIFDPIGMKPVRAVQCKHHETNKALQPADIKAEVAKAERSQIAIEHYVIATTAKKSKAAQNAVLALNSRPATKRRFTVELQYWEDICQQFTGLNRIQIDLIVFGRDTAYEVLAAIRLDPEIATIAREFGQTSGPPVSHDVYSEIDQLLKQRKLELAEHELKKLPGLEASVVMSADDRYKLTRLHAIHALESGDYREAFRLFLSAYELKPDLEQARLNRVLAYSLVGDALRAFELAREYVQSGIATPTMLCRLIESAPNLESLSDYSGQIATLVATSEDVNIALYHKCVECGDEAGATEAARRCIELSPRSPHANFTVALQAHHAALRGPWKERKPRLKEALTLYGVALAGSKETGHRVLAAEILQNRATVNMLLGDMSAAGADYKAAVFAAPKPEAYALRAVSFFLHMEDFAAAWEFSDKLGTTPTGRFYAAFTEFLNAEGVDERRLQLQEMRRILHDEAADAIELRMHVIHAAIELKDFGFAREVVADDFTKQHPFEAHVALAWIALCDRDEAGAASNAAKALEEDSHDVHPMDLRVLAETLKRLKQDERALDVYERIVTQGILDDDQRNYIICAQRLGRHDVLLKVCRELRETGEQDEQLRRLEIQLLNEYAPAEGLAVVDELIGMSPSPGYFVAHKNVLAVRLGQQEVLQLTPSHLPQPDELPVAESRLVTLPYVALRRFDEALQFLYAQLRHNFEAEDAHGQYVYYFLTYGDKCSLRQAPSTVSDESAVLLETVAGSPRWIVIERQNPVPSRGEIGPDTELARRLVGRSVGDRVELPGAFVPGETATVSEIQSKYVRAFQDSTEHFSERFSEGRFLQQVRIGSGESFDPAPLIESLRQRRDYVQNCFSLYESHPCPLHLLAKRLGVNMLAVMSGIRHHPTAVLKCSISTAAEFERLAKKGVRAQSIVLDLTAIVTLSLADGWSLLDGSGPFVVSQTTMETIDHWIGELSDQRGKEGGHASLGEGDQLQFWETTEEEIEVRHALLVDMRAEVQDRCESRSSSLLASFPTERRDLYRETLGFHGAESLCVAKDATAVLWTDDVVQALLAKSEFGVEPVWTQLAARVFADAGRVSQRDFEALSAKLVGLKYNNLVWNPHTIIAGGRLSDWAPRQSPFRECIALISRSELTLPQKASVALECIKLLRRSSCTDLRQSAVIQAIFDAVASRRAVEAMFQRLEREFAVDPVSTSFLVHEFEYWFRVSSIVH